MDHVLAPLSPDFAPHDKAPGLNRARCDGDWVCLDWADGLSYRAYGTFLRENEVTNGIVSDVTREREIEIDRLPDACPLKVNIDADGNLSINWAGGATSRFSSAWLYDLARGQWHPDAELPSQTPWTTTDLPEPPSFDGPSFLAKPEHMIAPLRSLWEFGLMRLRGLPIEPGTVQRVAETIGTVRNSNFGFLFSVETKPNPDRNAYRAAPLDAHTDLATRETQPGFQLLHCQENTAMGGESTMVDGFAVARAIQAEDANAFERLNRDAWIFTNRHQHTDYRCSGPVIETNASGDPIEIRNTGFLRFYPDMDDARVPAVNEALRRFTAHCRDPAFQMATPLKPLLNFGDEVRTTLFKVVVVIKARTTWCQQDRVA